MSFEMPPHVFERIEFGRINWQPFDHEATLRGGHAVFDQHTSLDRCDIADSQHFSGNMSLELSQKPDDLEAFDAAGMDL